MPGIGKTSFVPGEIVPADIPGASIRYCSGFNCSGSGEPEVLQVIRTPDGTERTYVIMRGLSRTKAEAIAMILNAPEE